VRWWDKFDRNTVELNSTQKELEEYKKVKKKTGYYVQHENFGAHFYAFKTGT
jgi:hypothetical protein